LSPVPRSAIDRAILSTLAYADIFDFPLTSAEIHRFLIGHAATQSEVERALAPDRLEKLSVFCSDSYYCLAWRSELIDTRQQRAGEAERLWPIAIRYGGLMGSLPFTRMVAVTGALAMNNPEPAADIDYLIVTQAGRLWLCRAMVVLLVKVAAREEIELCPNFLLAENRLEFGQRNLYTAHEVVQMVPLAGASIYRQFIRANDWAFTFLPNAAVSPDPMSGSAPTLRALTVPVEVALRTPLGGWLERWEMERKIAKLANQGADGAETAFSPSHCKGHFGNHEQMVLAAYGERLGLLELT
jgi:hypothetical protein